MRRTTGSHRISQRKTRRPPVQRPTKLQASLRTLPWSKRPERKTRGELSITNLPLLNTNASQRRTRHRSADLQFLRRWEMEEEGTASSSLFTRDDRACCTKVMQPENSASTHPTGSTVVVPASWRPKFILQEKRAAVP